MPSTIALHEPQTDSIDFNDKTTITRLMQTPDGIREIFRLRRQEGSKPILQRRAMECFILFRSVMLMENGEVSVLPEYVRDAIADLPEIMTQTEMWNLLQGRSDPWIKSGVLSRPLQNPLELITEKWPTLKAA